MARLGDEDRVGAGKDVCMGRKERTRVAGEAKPRARLSRALQSRVMKEAGPHGRRRKWWEGRSKDGEYRDDTMCFWWERIERVGGKGKEGRESVWMDKWMNEWMDKREK